MNNQTTHPQGQNQARQLRAAIAAKGTTIKATAEAIGISPSSFYRKADRRAEFTLEEIRRTADYLHLTSDQIKTVFFDDANTRATP